MMHRRVCRSLSLFLGQLALFVLLILLVCALPQIHIWLLQLGGVCERTGLSRQEMASIANAMAEVTRGADREILSRWFTSAEVLHMKDVQWLFGVGKWLLLSLVTASAAFCTLSIGLPRQERPSCARWALALSICVPIAIAVPFCVDFTGMFVFLHRLAFPDNTLWLMNPAIHIMVVIYNETFFIRAVAVIGAACVLSLLPLANACRSKK